MIDRSSLDVAIIGGGPGGLAAAAAILRTRPELKVRIFERESRLRRVGNFVGFYGNGQSALRAIHPKVFERVKRDLVRLDRRFLRQFGEEGVTTKFDKPADVVAWYNMRQGLSEMIPKECLKMGYILQDLGGEDDGVGVNFSSPEESYHAKVVIGCDGYRSQVREICMQDGPPIFMNRLCWRGVLKCPDDWPYSKSTTVHEVSEKKRHMFISMLDDQYLGWQYFLRLEDQDVDPVPYSRSVQIAPSGTDHKARCLDMFEGNSPDYLMKLLKGTSPESFTEHGIFSRHPDSCSVWGKGCITLLGDAAHATTPHLGQGTSQAFIDAVELGRAIGELGPCDEALRQYESERIEPMHLIQKGSWDSSQGFFTEAEWYEQNPWCLSYVAEPLLIQHQRSFV